MGSYCQGVATTGFAEGAKYELKKFREQWKSRKERFR